MIAKQDAKQFADCLSAQTRAELLKESGVEKPVDLFVNFVLQRTRDELPLTFVDATVGDEAQQIKFRGRNIQGVLRMIREKDEWKIDLVQAAGSWKEIEKWSRRVAGHTATGPLLGREGKDPILTIPGISDSQSDGDSKIEALRDAFGPYVPGFTKALRPKPQS